MKETDLCASFARRASACGWTVYPEVAGYDLVLVWSGDAPAPRYHYWRDGFIDDERDSDPQPGDQVGVHAKLRPGVEVLAQTIRGAEVGSGPDYRAVLVPKAGRDFTEVCHDLRVGVYVERLFPEEAIADEYATTNVLVAPPPWRWKRTERLWLPPIVPTFAGGAPSPRQLSKWRVGALRICALLRSRGFVTKEDFAREGIALSTWLQRGWIVGSGLPRRYAIAAAELLPDVGYEAERDALAAHDEAAR